MIIREKIKNHFLNLMQDDKFATYYFLDKSIMIDFTNEKLVELQNRLKSTRKNDRGEKEYLYSAISTKNNRVIANAVSCSEQSHRSVMRCINDLEIFESNLAYLLIKGRIDRIVAKLLGFSDKYIEDLLIRYQRQVDNPYIEYYIDDKTGQRIMLYNPYDCDEKQDKDTRPSYYMRRRY